MVELKIVQPARELDQSELTAIARLHVSAMSETLTSIRGEKAVSRLYCRLLENGGSIVMAAENDSVIGVLSYTVDHSRIASMGTIFSKPLSWLQVISKKGLVGLVRELNDAYNVSRKVRTFDNQMLYITTLFVDSRNQNLGIATRMFDLAREQSKLMCIPLVVDTRANNDRAIHFYERQGMREFARTSMSMILKS